VGRGQISDEAALRFPNVLFGALTALPLFLLTAAFFDRRTALIAAALWAFGINAITYNRIAKEDTLLVFFMLFAFYFYLRGKQTSGYDQKRKRWYYGWSGVSFGLMLASKYFPHYFGLNALYHHLFRVRRREPGEPSGKVPGLFYVLILVVFLLANPAVLLPQTWQYLNFYASEQLLKHTGYLMGDHLYKNNPSSTPFWGTPLYFYVLFLAVKVPLPLILAFLVGLVRVVRRWRHPGHGFLLLMFLLWIIPYSLFGAKWLRYTLSLMPFVYMIASMGIVTLTVWCASLLKSAGAEGGANRLAGAIALLLFIALPAWTAYANAPHYAAYTNALGGGRAGYFFPHDEFYDDGLREAIRFVCDEAPQGATVVHETPGVARYYLGKYGRTDLNSRVLSDANFKLEVAQGGPTYIILQRGRTYFENQDKVRVVRATLPKVFEVTVKGTSAVEVYATHLR
jgi:4-amino-4-deoxy-L-arabinose transferase-like glycosyltransferase